MTNEAIRKYLVDGYNEVTFTHNYVFGWASKDGMIYGYKVNNAKELIAWISTLDVASKKNGGTIQLKFRLNLERKNIIMTKACEIKPICSIAEFENIRNNSIGIEKNRGYIFERLACEVFGMEQNKKPNEKSCDCGDAVDVNGNHYQMKYENATFIDERTLKNFKKNA